MDSISPRSLKELLDCDEPVRLIDVRTPVEFREAHVRGAVNVPLDRLDRGVLAGSDGARVCVICQSGARAATACQKLAAWGAPRVTNVEGGVRACVRDGLEVVRGRRAVSLERQVRIAAGALVVAGSAVSAFYPYAVAVPAAVGAGLVFSGVTNSCAMGMALARMPWNQVSDEPDDAHAPYSSTAAA